MQLEDATSSWLTKAHSQVCDTSFIAALHATEIRTEPRSCKIFMASHAEHKSAPAKPPSMQPWSDEWTFNEEATLILG